MLSLKDCTRNNLCVDCDEEECLHHGSTMADCPKYGCDNDSRFDCENCDFIKKYQEERRKHYGKI